ncbi:MAG TPA: UbiD family decarboxylase [Ignisphaera sp.]|nr:UbiD family decarboxylase [Ignisphaera sp.]
MSLREFVYRYANELVEISNPLPPEPTLTKNILPLERKGLIILFKVLGSEFECVSGVLSTRRRLFELLGVRNDVEAYLKILSAISKPSKAKVVDFDNYFERSAVDLRKLPFIKFFPRDGGKYVTSAIFIACLNEDTCNASIHRTMLIDSNRVVARIVPRHLRYIYNEYRKRGQSLPVAIVVGVHPAVLLSAALSPPFGIFELDVASTLFPDMRIAYTPNYGLPVPVPAAVVIEARIGEELVDEGPFVDILGLYDGVRKEPLIHIDALYINAKELFHVIIPSGDEHVVLQSFFREALIWDSVRRVVPRVKKVRLTRASGGWLQAVISISKMHDGDAKNAILAAFAAHPSLKYVIVVDEDIDPDDIEAVLWAINTRVRPSKDIVIIRGARCSSLDPSSENGLCDKVGIDATIPLSSDRARYVHAYSDLGLGEHRVSNHVGREST